MKPARARRIDAAERSRAQPRRTHFLFQDDGESSADVQARIRAMIESGQASADGRFVIFRWRAPEGEEADD
jgi:hypothetical protein